MRLFRSGLRKLLRRPASWVTFGLLAGLLVLIFVAVGATSRTETDGQAAVMARTLVTFPGAYTFVLGFILGLGGLLALTYGAAIAGSEWQWGTLKAAVARGESRTVYTLATYASIVAMVLVGVLAAFVVGVVAAAIGAVLAGVDLGGITDARALGDLPEQWARGALTLAMTVAIGFAVATVAKSQLAGIGIGLGLFFGEQFAGIFLPDIVQYLPFSVAGAVQAGGGGFGPGGGGGGGGPGGAMLEPTAALIAAVAWLVGALAFASAWTERAEIGG